MTLSGVGARVTPEQVEALIEILPDIGRDYPDALAAFVQHLRRLDEAIEIQSTDQPYGVMPLNSADLAAGLHTAIRNAMGRDADPDLVDGCMDRITATLNRADVRTQERVERGAAAWR